MNAIAQMLIDGLMAVEQTVGASVAWPFIGGQTYPCVGGPELGGKLLGMGGFRTTAQVTIVVRSELFAGAKPAEKQKLIYTSAPDAAPRNLRIDSVTSFQGALLVLECNDPNQGANSK